MAGSLVKPAERWHTVDASSTHMLYTYIFHSKKFKCGGRCWLVHTSSVGGLDFFLPQTDSCLSSYGDGMLHKSLDVNDSPNWFTSGISNL